MSRLKPFSQPKTSIMKNPLELEKNFQETPLDADFFASLMTPQESFTAQDLMVSPEKQEMNPIVKDFLTKKIQEKKQASNPEVSPVDSPVEQPASKLPSFMDQFSEDKYNEAKKQYEDNSSGLGIAQFIAGIGDAMAGRNPAAETARQFAQYRQEAKDNTIGDFEKRKQNAIADFKTKQMLQDEDPNSESSKNVRNLLKEQLNQAGMSKLANSISDSMSARQINEKMPQFASMINTKLRTDESKQARQDSAALRAESKAAREYEKNQTLETTYGTARTPDDAKQLKSAAETKAKFDRQLQELINLRKDKGVEYLDRNAVARGKQLSRDLLLAYKDLSKLGVLSQSDENILNDIIPNDPLGQDWAPGQDPTLHKLEKFQGDVESDFNNRLDQRLRNPNNPQRQKQQQKFPIQVRKGNQVATVSNEQELKEAREEGFQ